MDRAREQLSEAQQKEVLARLREAEEKPNTLKPFGRADLERMIQEASQHYRANAR